METVRHLDDRSAMRRAWFRWSVLSGACAVAVGIVVTVTAATAEGGGGGDGVGGGPWALLPLLWLMLAVPASVVMNAGSLGRGWASDRTGPADRADYLKGMSAVWSVLAVGVALSLAACLVAGDAEPAIWPGAVMLMLLVLARPGAV